MIPLSGPKWEGWNAACRASSMSLTNQLPGPPGSQLPPTAQELDHTNPQNTGLLASAPLPCRFSMFSLRTLSRFSHVQLCVTPWPAAHQALLSMGFCRQEHWSGLLCPSPADMLNPGIERLPLTSNLHWQRGSLPLLPPGKPQCRVYEIVTTGC